MTEFRTSQEVETPQTLMAAFHIAAPQEAAERRREERDRKYSNAISKPKTSSNYTTSGQQKPLQYQPGHRPPMNTGHNYSNYRPPTGHSYNNYRPPFNQNPSGFRYQQNPNMAGPSQPNNGYRPQLQASPYNPQAPNWPQQQALPPYIEPDPSGQNRQPLSKQLLPYRHLSNINSNEVQEGLANDYSEYPDTYGYEENTEFHVDQNLPPQVEESQEELNFCLDTEQLTTE